MTEELKQFLGELEKLEANNRWEEIEEKLESLSNDEQFRLDIYLRFGHLSVEGLLVFPYRNGKYFNDRPRRWAPWIENRTFQIGDTWQLGPVENKDNYCVCNILDKESERRRIVDVTFINELYLDIDLAHNLDGATRKRLLKKVRIRLDELFDSGRLPRCLFGFTGRGFCLHYILVNPIDASSDDAIKFAALYQCAMDFLESLFDDMRDSHVDIDRSVCSLNRLSRMMGSKNTKAANLSARFIAVVQKRYTLDELMRTFVRDPVDFTFRCNLKARGRRITKSAMVKEYEKLARQAEKDAKKREKLPKQASDKMEEAKRAVKSYRDGDSMPCVDYDPARAHRARYALMKLDKFFATRKWIDGDKRSEFAWMVYNCARTLYTQDKAEFIMCDYSERMEDPLDNEVLDRIIDSAEELVFTEGETYLPSYETLIERLQIDRQMACDLGFCADAWKRQRDEHIATAYDRDVLIMDLYNQGYSYSEIAEKVKEEYPDSDISKTTAYRRVQKLKNVDFSTVKRTIYAAYQLGDTPRKPKGWVLPFQHFYNDDKEEQMQQMQGDDLDWLNKSDATSRELNKEIIPSEAITLPKVSLEQDLNLKEMILNDLLARQDVCIFGVGGTGKSYIIRKFINACETRRIAVIAPTGVASSNLPGGVTIHKFLGISQSTDLLANPEVVPETLTNIDCLIIDELSMCRADLFDYMERCLRMVEQQNGRHIQRVFLADLKQIPPVIPDEEKKRLSYWYESKKYMFFDSTLFKELQLKYYRCDYNHRANQEEREFATMLLRIHENDATVRPYFNQRVIATREVPQNAVYLAAWNKEVDRYNAYMINQHRGEPSFCYSVAEYISGENNIEGTFDVETRIPLFIGMPIMTIRNRLENGYANGTFGTVVKINAKSIIMQKRDGTTAKVERELFASAESESVQIRQLPIKVAFSMSINKCQGLTLDVPVVVNPYCFECGQLYTALSRIRTLDNLYLTDKIPESSMIPNPEADAFLASIELITAENMHQYVDNTGDDTD